MIRWPISPVLYRENPILFYIAQKTWEGTIGGVIFCVITIALLSRVIEPLKFVPVIHWIVIAFICAVG
jgi:CDP-diglyceride synthetase